MAQLNTVISQTCYNDAMQFHKQKVPRCLFYIQFCDEIIHHCTYHQFPKENFSLLRQTYSKVSCDIMHGSLFWQFLVRSFLSNRLLRYKLPIHTDNQTLLKRSRELNKYGDETFLNYVQYLYNKNLQHWNVRDSECEW